jgi:hypothetical protein
VLSRLRHRLTYANVAATLALVFAMGGSAVAATHYLITSTKQISPKVLKELKKTGANGAVGPAGAAGPQGPGGTSGTAGANGTNGAPGSPGAKGEPGVTGPQGLEGQTGPEGPEGGTTAALKRWRKTVPTPGTTKAAATKVTLAVIGPFTISGHCYEFAEVTVAETYISSSQAGAVAAEPEEGEQIALPLATEVSITPEPAEGESGEARFKGPNGGLFSAETKSGSLALDGASNEGVYLNGTATPACYFSGYAVEQS